MIKYLVSLFLLLSFSYCDSISQSVKTGLEVAENDNFSFLKDKRVGLITNPTGINSSFESTIDILFRNPQVNLIALFGPEHGVRGSIPAGEKVSSYTDPKTKLPVYSLYGRTRKPTKEMLNGIDVLVFDIQDIGSRSYTYISTMGLAMEAAAENDIEFVVLDRPNPLGGNRIEGNLVEDGYFSFVSKYNVPYVHSFTVGEFARFLNGEKQLSNGIQCKLDVIKMVGWKRSISFEDTGLPWIPTSPHIPEASTPLYYTSTGILGELGVISEGVGYTTPFKLFAAEWINAQELANAMNALKIDGVHFRPTTVKPYYAKHKGKTIHGVQIHFTDASKVNLMSLQFRFMEVHHKLYPNIDIFEKSKDRHRMFDLVNGTSKIRELFSKNYQFSNIEKFLNKDVESFRQIAKKYYLYK